MDLQTRVSFEMPDPLTGILDPARILFDLQQGNEIAQRFSGCLDPEEIARRLTDGLVETFDCAFARVWLVEPDQTALKLVASSGMYTHLNGSFARVPMGAYKVGKIAQNRVPFLSNNLAAEAWVGNREWAIANTIRGFAGYPLIVQNRVIGVLAIFSHHAIEPEFLEILQMLCTMVAIALDTATQFQTEKRLWQTPRQQPAFIHLPLSDQLANSLSASRLMLVGTEQPLSLPITYLFLQAAERLNSLACSYCRLIYAETTVSLEAIVPTANLMSSDEISLAQVEFGELGVMASCLGGGLQTQSGVNQKVVQVTLQIPYCYQLSEGTVRIQCCWPVLQQAFTHLAGLAGLRICPHNDETPVLLTDDFTQIHPSRRVLWIQHDTQVPPKGVMARVDLSTNPTQLRQAVAAVTRGEKWGIETERTTPQILSERELEILALLTQGLRDRDIADDLIISESTVKFHINNALSKLKARTRYQAIYEVVKHGWI